MPEDGHAPSVNEQPIYDRGAGTLHALRGRVGEEAFFAATREWIALPDDSTGTAEDFVANFEEESGQELTESFDTWLVEPEKPADW